MEDSVIHPSDDAAIDMHATVVDFDPTNLAAVSPSDTFDEDSQVSDLSSTDLLLIDLRLHRIAQMDTEQERENIVRSSRQRRAQRRQWNPSIHQSSRADSPTHHPSDEVIPISLAMEYRMRFRDARVGVDVEMDDTKIRSGAGATSGSSDLEIGNDGPDEHESGDFDDPNDCVHPDDPDQSVHPDSAASNVIDHNTISCQLTREAASDSKYESYECLVDTTQDDKSLEIHLYSMKRPHMRSFHLAWMAFFTAFFTWFAITPLLPEVQRSLDMTHKEIWTSSSFGVASSAFTRVIIGPICDKYGARWSMAGTLVVSAIPTALTGLVQSATGLYVLRLFIGLAGSAFVSCQYWSYSMFTVEVAGTANALVAGWGNLGGGVTQIVMGSIVFPLFKSMYGGETSQGDDFDRASDLAWRTACVVPAVLCLVMAFVVIRYSDDSPKGNYSKRGREGHMPEVSTTANIKAAVFNLNTWILFVQYGCCFGVEITMMNACALYFHDVFGQSTESAAAIASIFGWMNLFARGVGGFLSDLSNAKYGIRGRLWFQVIILLLEGIFIILFGYTQSLAWAICAMIVLSVFVQAAAGSTFGIVPYINHSVTGSVAGIVGAGGNVGGVAFSLIFGNHSYATSFTIMGAVVLSSALLSLGFIIRGHAALCVGGDSADVVRRREDYNASFGATPPPLRNNSSHHIVDMVDDTSLSNLSRSPKNV